MHGIYEQKWTEIKIESLTPKTMVVLGFGCGKPVFIMRELMKNDQAGKSS